MINESLKMKLSCWAQEASGTLVKVLTDLVSRIGGSAKFLYKHQTSIYESKNNKSIVKEIFLSF